MRKSRFSADQIIGILEERLAGLSVAARMLAVATPREMLASSV